MTLLTLSRGDFFILSRDEEPKSFAPTSASLSPAAKPTLGPNSAASQMLMYIENDLQQILKAVLEARTPVAWRGFNEPRE